MRKIPLYGLTLILTLCIASFTFPAYSQACNCNVEKGTEFFQFNSHEIAFAAPGILQKQEGEEGTLLESILIYAIIFIPVVLITLTVWIFSRILKLTNKKE
ncbi:hypothetical protein V1502_09725 [Bacillus sp. SCS-153A]|uniref:hypothetical protein n=1 Tax=Rossellomorea sedimentorum TaxID=3115294 RepID=UPI0039068DA7